jgi:hypothetical protein
VAGQKIDNYKTDRKYFLSDVATGNKCSIFVPTDSIEHFEVLTGQPKRKFPKLKIIYLPCLSLMHTWGVFFI